jgi:hypothetical protein
VSADIVSLLGRGSGTLRSFDLAYAICAAAAALHCLLLSFVKAAVVRESGGFSQDSRREGFEGGEGGNPEVFFAGESRL